jgi:hypothetical protein
MLNIYIARKLRNISIKGMPYFCINKEGVMGKEVRTEELVENGKKTFRRYDENNVLISVTECETAETGMKVSREYTGNNELLSELYGYSGKVMLQRTYQNKELIEEIYFGARNLISKKKYLQLLQDYKDMPKPAEDIVDVNAELIKAVKALKDAWKEAFSKHKPDSLIGKEIDDFCRNMLEEEDKVNFTEIKEAKKVLVGEFSEKKSCKLLEKLQALQCGSIYLTDCEEDDEYVGCNGIVCELPKESENRKEALLYFGKLAQEMGFEGDFDNGQQYAFLKF